MKRISIPASFDPDTGQIDASNIPFFNPSRVMLISNVTSRVSLYDFFTPGLGFVSVSGDVLTVEVDTSGQSSADLLWIVWDDDGSLIIPRHGVVTPGASIAALPNVRTPNGAVIKALPLNSGVIYVGGSTLTTGSSTNGFPLIANESLSFASFSNLNAVYAWGNGTDKLAYFIS